MLVVYFLVGCLEEVPSLRFPALNYDLPFCFLFLDDYDIHMCHTNIVWWIG
jgi:hypothetical protein